MLRVIKTQDIYKIYKIVTNKKHFRKTQSRKIIIV